ncbi:hypothetical protein [Burkholderia cepacia]|nr:hypothetical protein [Burkholderia cepacia]
MMGVNVIFGPENGPQLQDNGRFVARESVSFSPSVRWKSAFVGCRGLR